MSEKPSNICTAGHVVMLAETFSLAFLEKKKSESSRSGHLYCMRVCSSLSLQACHQTLRIAYTSFKLELLFRWTQVRKWERASTPWTKGTHATHQLQHKKNCICEPRECSASNFCVLLHTNHHNHINSLKSRKHSRRIILPLIVYRQCLYKIQLLEKFRMVH